MTFPCTKAAKGKYKGLDQWPLTASKLAEYTQSYPNVNHEVELKKARQWLVDNNRKTYTGMPAFLNRWLSKAQDQARPGGGVYTPAGRGPQTPAADYLKRQTRGLFDQHGTPHEGDPNDE